MMFSKYYCKKKKQFKEKASLKKILTLTGVKQNEKK